MNRKGTRRVRVSGSGVAPLGNQRQAPLPTGDNVYAGEKLLDYAREMIAASGRPVSLSALRWFPPDAWPADIRGELARWEAQGVERLFVNIGSGADPRRRVVEIAAAL